MEPPSSDRLAKRSSSDVGLVPSVKRKYRRRKLSSSNESSSSESPSLVSETAPHQNIPTSPPITSTHSPTIFHGEKRVESEDTIPVSDSQTNEMDCGNLDLLASVTQRVDKVDRLTNEASSSPIPAITTSTFANEPPPLPPPLPPPPVKIRGSPAPSVSMTTAPDLKEAVKRNVGVGGRTGRKRKSTSANNNNNTAANQQSSSDASSQLSPPTSLQELLERQWEQTAQFILDQAGKQNNAGVMLAHLHELQSENRTMQSRIMELASQREFFIATNSRLRQTLTGVTPVTKAINGMQIMSPPNATSMQPTMTNHAHHSSYHRPIEENLPARSTQHHQVSMVTDTKSSRVTMNSFDTNNKFLEGHSSTFGNTLLHNRGGVSDPFPGSAPKLNHSSCPVSLVNSSLSTASPYRHVNETTPITIGMHEVTHVTNSVQGPIATFTGFPDNPAPHYPSHQSLAHSHRHST